MTVAPLAGEESIGTVGGLLGVINVRELDQFDQEVPFPALARQ